MQNKNKLRKKYIYPSSWDLGDLRHDYFSIITLNNNPANFPFLIRTYNNGEISDTYSTPTYSNYYDTDSYAVIFSNIYLDFYYNAFIIFPEPKHIFIQQHSIHVPNKTLTS